MANKIVTITCAHCHTQCRRPYVYRFCSRYCCDEYKKAQWPQRFQQKVNKNGPIMRPELGPCWVWEGTITSNGYGWFTRTLNGVDNSVSAHVAAFELAYGPVPEGLIVRHKCDNKPCVNPAHLEPGTSVDNARDRDSRGRAKPARGRQFKSTKLDEGTVRAIREKYAARVPRAGSKWMTVTYQSLADEYGTTSGNIGCVLRNETWQYL